MPKTAGPLTLIVPRARNRQFFEGREMEFLIKSFRSQQIEMTMATG